MKLKTQIWRWGKTILFLPEILILLIHALTIETGLFLLGIKQDKKS